MSAWISCPTFSSNVIFAISSVTKASVLASLIAAGVAAWGHRAGWAREASGTAAVWAKAGAPPPTARARTIRDTVVRIGFSSQDEPGGVRLTDRKTGGQARRNDNVPTLHPVRLLPSDRSAALRRGLRNGMRRTVKPFFR